MSREEKKTMCKVVIICGTKALVLKRSRLVIYHPRRWDIPGGALDSGETTERATVREALEEAGIKLDKTKLKLVGQQSKMRDGKPAVRLCYSYYVEEEFAPKLSFEHSGYAWLEVSELDEINLPNFYKDCIRDSLGLANVELF